MWPAGIQQQTCFIGLQERRSSWCSRSILRNLSHWSCFPNAFPAANSCGSGRIDYHIWPGWPLTISLSRLDCHWHSFILSSPNFTRSVYSVTVLSVQQSHSIHNYQLSHRLTHSLQNAGQQEARSFQTMGRRTDGRRSKDQSFRWFQSLGNRDGFETRGYVRPAIACDQDLAREGNHFCDIVLEEPLFCWSGLAMTDSRWHI